MRSDAIVVASVRFQNAAHMCLAQNNDVIQTLAPDRSDQPFAEVRIEVIGLERRLRCRVAAVALSDQGQVHSERSLRCLARLAANEDVLDEELQRIVLTEPVHALESE